MFRCFGVSVSGFWCCRFGSSYYGGGVGWVGGKEREVLVVEGGDPIFFCPEFASLF